MGVGLGYPSVGCPTGMGDSGEVTIDIGLLVEAEISTFSFQGLAQLGQVADSADFLDPTRDQHRDSGRIVAAVLEVLQPGDEYLLTGTVADISDDSAHKSRKLLAEFVLDQSDQA